MNPFPGALKTLRQRLVGKQTVLSYAIGCTDAAVSFWEAGRRLPGERMMERIVSVLRFHGGDAGELDELVQQWRREVERRLDKL